MVTPAHTCRTVTLTDQPEETDAFGGPHQRIADAIAGLIQPTDAKGISIGVEGSWGSGKSTVARLLSKKLEADQNVETVYFDAWAHEGDPLRRTFLEAIIRKLQTSGWITKPDWDECIEELANRREVVKTKDSLSITRAGRLIAFTLLLIPIGSAFITAALRDNNLTLYPGPLAWKFIILFLIGLLLTFTPLIVLLLKIKEEPDLLSVLFNKGPTEKTTVTSKTVNPTSIEFEENFDKLLDAALGDNQKRLVLILDNLDRVDAKDALSIWSTLQTFLQHKGMSPRAWHERLWLLVLYDFDGLSLLWENSDNARGKTALSFIDKSFQVRFEVPALVSSDWRQFLMDQLAKAFPDHSESDLHDVYRVLATHLAPTNQHLSIRELKLFVNQIGAIHRQWAASADRESDAFALPLISYYVLLRRRGTDVVNSLFNPEFPSKAYQELLGDTVRENLAGLAFNVEVDVAQQLLFADKIRNALTLGSSEELRKVASLLRRGFWEVFEQTAKDWANTETVKVAEAALALEQTGLLNDAFPPLAKAVMKAFSDRVGSLEVWASLDRVKAQGIAAILKWKINQQGASENTDAYVKRLFKAFVSGLGEHQKEFDEDDVAEEWTQSVILVGEGLNSSDRHNVLHFVVEELAAQFRSAGPDSRKMARCLEVLFELEKNAETGSTAEKTLRSLADSGNIKDAYLGERSPNSRAVAFMLYALIRYSSRFEEIPTRADLVFDRDDELSTLFADEAMVQSFVRVLIKYEQISVLFSLRDTGYETEPLVRESFKLIVKNPDAKKIFTGPNALVKLEHVVSLLPKSTEQVVHLTRLITELQQEWDVLSALRGEGFKPSNATLYLSALRASNGNKEEFFQWCNEGIHSVASDFWNYELVRLAFELSSGGAKLELGENFGIFVKGIITSTERQWYRFEGENIVALAGPVSSESRNFLQQELEKRLKDSSVGLQTWFFSIFGLELTTMVQTERYLDLLETVLQRMEPQGHEFVSSVFGQIGGDLEARYSNEPAWIKFTNALSRTLNTTPEDHKRDGEIRTLTVGPPRNGDIAYVNDEAQICLLNPITLETRILLEAAPSSGYKLTEPSWSPDGKKLSYTRSKFRIAEIFVLEVVSGSTIQITASDHQSSQSSWSPDGDLLAFVREVNGEHDIYTINVSTREERRLTQDGAEKVRPKWSPDSGKLVFNRLDSMDGKICVIDANGSNEILIHEGLGVVDPSWSIDGQRVVFACWPEDARPGLYLVNADGSDPFLLVRQFDTILPSWSPDGEKLLFQSGVDREARIYQTDANGQNMKALTNGKHPAWQPLITDGPDETPESPSGPLRAFATAG